MPGRLRPTLRHVRARHYIRPGGPWDVPSLDHVLSSTPGEGERVVDGDSRLTGPALEEQIARLAGGLRAAGVRRGDAVAWQLPNSIEALLLYRACWRLGAIAAPVHHGAGRRDLDASLSQVGARVFVTKADEVGSLVDRGTGRPLSLEASPAKPTDLAVALSTSGSTGVPKVVLHSHRGLAYKAKVMAAVHGLRASDAILMPAPLAHVSGLLNGVLVPGVAAMKAVFMARWDPEQALATIDQERISFMIGPPTFFVALMGAAQFSSARVASLRLVSCGGAGVTPAFVRSAAETLGARVKRTYGSTEAPTVTTSGPRDPEEKAATTDGRPTGEAELRVAADGELLLRGPELFVGYVDPDQTAAAHTRGWFKTGDLATIDDDGWLTIVGRKKDIVIRGGENISVAEVEAVLEAHPAVRQAVALGYPDEKLGERLAAFVVASEPFDLDSCRRWFADQGVTRFKTPERIVQVRELPTLAAGKPDRAALKAALAENA